MDGYERREMKQVWSSSHHKLFMELRDLRGTFCLCVNVKHVVVQSSMSPMEKGIASLLSWRRQGPGKSPACPWLPVQLVLHGARDLQSMQHKHQGVPAPKHQHCCSSICPFTHLPNINTDFKSPASISDDFSVTKPFTSLG